jgi:two-component system, LytTR family, sensor kinase
VNLGIEALSIFPQTAEPNLAGQLVGYGVGTILSSLFLALVSRPSESNKRLRYLALCGLVWNACGLASYVVHVMGASSSIEHLADLTKFGVGKLWPVSAVAVWLNNDALSLTRRKLGKWLLGLSIATGALLFLAQFGWFWQMFPWDWQILRDSTARYELIRNLGAYNALAVVGAGAWLLLAGQVHGWFQKLAVTSILLGLTINTVCAALHAYLLLPLGVDSVVVTLEQQSIILAVIGALFYFARFRALDVFVKLSLRVIIAATLALSASYVAFGPLETISQKTIGPYAVRIAGLTALLGLVVFLTARFATAIDAFVETYVFGKPNYRQAAAQLREKLGLLETAPEIFVTTEQFVRSTLQLDDLRILPQAELSRLAETHVTEFAEPQGVGQKDADGPIPITVGHQTPYFLAFVAQGTQSMVLSMDFDFLREVSVLVGRRLEALEHEKDRVARARHEAQLSHQVLSAELRALRAQVNPHFLFNSLNTIAALIPPEPEKAELMTVRLAKVFRHVLTHTDRSFSTVEEEIDFVRTYLEIEKVRFGDRLSIQIEVSKAAEAATVPSLILQPLVENALKHGLAPKLGANKLIIRGNLAQGYLCLSVEDNGVGLKRVDRENATPSTGLGLRNVEERLRTIYGSKGTLVLQNIVLGGSRATLQFPAGGIAW